MQENFESLRESAQQLRQKADYLDEVAFKQEWEDITSECVLDGQRESCGFHYCIGLRYNGLRLFELDKHGIWHDCSSSYPKEYLIKQNGTYYRILKKRGLPN